MPAANVPLVIDQGEDFTTQIIWTDENGNPQYMVDPMQMSIKSMTGQIVLNLSTPTVPPTDGSIPEISYSSDIGLVQIHIDRSQTAALQPGIYSYDLFVSISDQAVYAGTQQIRLLAGSVTVNTRVTVMS